MVRTQRDPDCPDMLLWWVSALIFFISVRVSGASAGVLALAGLRPARAGKRQGETHPVRTHLVTSLSANGVVQPGAVAGFSFG